MSTRTDTQNSVDNLKKLALSLRAKLVEMSHTTGAQHLGSSMSCIDILIVLYFKVLNVSSKDPHDIERDRFILSKGHAAAALYLVLAERGFLSKELLSTYAIDGSCLSEHPGVDLISGVDWATGSLGHGLSVAAGFAISSKLRKSSSWSFVLLSDGECNEGSVWEAAMFAPAKGLERICAIIDFNKWQATGRSREVLALEPLAEKWKSFGWDTYEVDGHNLEALTATFAEIKKQDKPSLVIAHTIKGKGVSFMEDDNNWHYRVPNKEELQLALKELEHNAK